MFMVCKCLNVAVNVTNIPSEYAGELKSENLNDQFFKKVIRQYTIKYCLLENVHVSVQMFA